MKRIVLIVVLFYSCFALAQLKKNRIKESSDFEIAELSTSKFKVKYPLQWNTSQVHGYTKTNSLAVFNNTKSTLSNAGFILLLEEYKTEFSLKELIAELIKKDLFRSKQAKNKEIISKEFFKNYVEIFAVYSIKKEKYKVRARYYKKDNLITSIRFRSLEKEFADFKIYNNLFFDSFVLK